MSGQSPLIVTDRLLIGSPRQYFWISDVSDDTIAVYRQIIIQHRELVVL